MEQLERFTAFKAVFMQTPLWQAMKNTREDSPWHREENVAVHTEMLLSWYKDNLFNSRSDRQRMLTMVGCLMHDIGKPPAQIIKHSEERGEYRAYHGHEQLSARMWVDYATKNKEVVEGTLKFTMFDVSNVALMLEHHVPFGLKDKVKRKNLKDAFMTRMGPHGHRAYLDLLMADQHGRVSDDQSSKLAAVDAWMVEWDKV